MTEHIFVFYEKSARAGCLFRTDGLHVLPVTSFLLTGGPAAEGVALKIRRTPRELQAVMGSQQNSQALRAS